MNMTPLSGDLLPARGRDVYRTASLVAIACVLQIAESLIPHPVPGVRLGLANMITLVTMADLGFAAALEVAVLRTVVSSLVLGSFLTPGFMLSFSSAIVSTVVMGLFWRFSAAFPAWGFSFIGISVASAVAHNATQLYLAYLLMIKHTSIFYFAPWLVISGVLMGWFTGLVAAEVLKNLQKGGARGHSTARAASAGPAVRAGISYLHRLAPEWKLAGAGLLICFTLAVKSWLFFPAAAAGLLALMLSTRLRDGDYSLILRKLRGLSMLASFSFLFPALFGRGDAGALLFSASSATKQASGLRRQEPASPGPPENLAATTAFARAERAGISLQERLIMAANLSTGKPKKTKGRPRRRRPSAISAGVAYRLSRNPVQPSSIIREAKKAPAARPPEVIPSGPAEKSSAPASPRPKRAGKRKEKEASTDRPRSFLSIKE